MIDLSTLIGIAGTVCLIVVGLASGELSGVFLNLHGIVIVFGGTTVALFINTPIRYMRDTGVAMMSLLRRDPFGDPDRVVPVLTKLAADAQQNGLGTLRNVDPGACGGFISEAATTALEYNNPEFVRKVLETQVNNRVDRVNEIINVIRTAGVLSPMFGLIGTLIGIVEVLKNIADPEAVAPAMAVAITTAFYGILFANILCIPIAGKLRIRLWEEVKAKAMVIEGVVGMMEGVVPLVLERRLESMR